jgi:hypothetical protein
MVCDSYRQRPRRGPTKGGTAAGVVPHDSARAAREESLPASKGRLRGDVLFFPNRYFNLWVVLVGNFNQWKKRIYYTKLNQEYRSEKI